MKTNIDQFRVMGHCLVCTFITIAIITSLTLDIILLTTTAQNMKFSIKDFFSKYDQILRKLRI